MINRYNSIVSKIVPYDYRSHVRETLSVRPALGAGVAVLGAAALLPRGTRALLAVAPPAASEPRPLPGGLRLRLRVGDPTAQVRDELLRRVVRAGASGAQLDGHLERGSVARVELAVGQPFTREEGLDRLVDVSPATPSHVTSPVEAASLRARCCSTLALATTCRAYSRNSGCIAS